jgi:hypothetical protein
MSCYWILGFIVSVILGQFAASLSVYYMRKWQSQKRKLGGGSKDDSEWKYLFGIKTFPQGEINDKKVEIRELPPILIGTIERFFLLLLLPLHLMVRPLQ